MENCLKCQRGRQDVTSKRARYPSEFEEIRQSLIHACSPHLVKVIHIQMQRRPQKDVGTSIREPLPTLPWNIFP